MSYILIFAIGVAMAVLVLPLALAAWSDGRPPRMAGALALGAALLIGGARALAPEGQSFPSLAASVFRLLARSCF